MCVSNKRSAHVVAIGESRSVLNTRKLCIRVLALVVCGAFWAPVSAQLYTWTDDQGRVHFGDRPYSGQAKEILQKPKRRTKARKKRLSREERKTMAASARNRGQKELEAYKAKMQARKDRRCTVAQAEVQAFTSGAQRVAIDENGRSYVLAGAAREERAKEWRAASRKWCL